LPVSVVVFVSEDEVIKGSYITLRKD